MLLNLGHPGGCDIAVDLWARLSIPSEILDRLTREHEVHRTTVIHHLDRGGIARRRVVRKMTDESVARAAARYDQGASPALVASEFGVHERTLAREFRRAGKLIRPRRGWRR